MSTRAVALHCQQVSRPALTDCAQASVLYCRHMNKEKPAVISPRVYKKHRKIIKSMSRSMKCSEAEVVRIALERLWAAILIKTKGADRG